MVIMGEVRDVEDVQEALRHVAAALLGEERAREMAAVLRQTAEHVWRIAKDPPPHDEEPAFYR